MGTETETEIKVIMGDLISEITQGGSFIPQHHQTVAHCNFRNEPVIN